MLRFDPRGQHVATINREGISPLLTHNLADFARYWQDVEVIALNP